MSAVPILREIIEETAVEPEPNAAEQESSVVAAAEPVDADIWPARRAKAFFEEPSSPVQAYVPGFVYAGAINALVGAAKVGKSTLTWSMLDCAMRGTDFLTEPCVSSTVLYASEQSNISFRSQMDRLPKDLSKRIENNEKFFLLLPEHHKYRDANGDEHPASDWPRRLAVWKALIGNPSVAPDIFVVDTFNAYADFPLGGENDNGLMAQRLFDLNALRAIKSSLAILLLHHVTKASETSKVTYLPLSAIRGGSAFAAGVDHIITLNRKGSANADESRTRYCYCQSRMTNERKFDVLWLPDGSYRKITEAEQKSEADAKKAAVFAAKHEHPDASYRDIEEMTGVSKSTAGRWLKTG